MIANGEITEDQAKMGYVGAYTYAEVISGYTSFFLGARSVCPSVTMEVTFTGSWYDETAEKERSKHNSIDDGCGSDQPACRFHGRSDRLRDNAVFPMFPTTEAPRVPARTPSLFLPESTGHRISSMLWWALRRERRCHRR